jgi:hypothetical protein
MHRPPSLCVRVCFPGENHFGVVCYDEEVLACDTVHHVGQVLAVVVATTRRCVGCTPPLDWLAGRLICVFWCEPVLLKPPQSWFKSRMKTAARGFLRSTMPFITSHFIPTRTRSLTATLTRHLALMVFRFVAKLTVLHAFMTVLAAPCRFWKEWFATAVKNTFTWSPTHACVSLAKV